MSSERLKHASRYCVDNKGLKASSSSVRIDMSPRVPSTAALQPHRSKKAIHPSLRMRRVKIENEMT
eukprot:scaffold23592_cov73-Skeletonema_dohrnii-CCMP3373.AAC.1